MYLHDLIKSLSPSSPVRDVPNVEVTGICEDSRKACPGSLFVARAGTHTDGAKFLADAQAKGAVAAVVQSKIPGCALPQFVHPDPAFAVSALAHLFYGVPCKKLKVLGVTGTNGKTTTTYLLRHILGKASQRCGMIGTVEIDDGKVRRESDMTTPGAVEVAQLLGTMRDKGCRAAAMEVSSHALHQRRVAAIDFAGAGFTNLTGDHMDYHKTMENYAAAKAMLFEMLSADAVAVVNAEDDWTPRMLRDCKARVFKFGFGKEGDYRARDIEITAQGTTFTLHCPQGKARVNMSLIGRHNIENALTAAALAGEVFHLSADQLAGALSDAAGAPGRLQSVRCGQPFAVLVDYAHTDDALQNVLTALRPLVPADGKLRVVFGCGGDRDATKRPRMAKTAEKLADVLYITSDNPRTEDPSRILREIEAGLSTPRLKPTTVEPDRRKAIEQVLQEAQAGDVVLIAGKGHENYQIIGTTKHHFDDVEEARRVLSSR
jgi:UDP-N-acetylmuramoyl-L-alanyl-D-glutamate--2,6-diaminopimelate ligase